MASPTVQLLRSFRDDIAMRRTRAWWRMLYTFSVIKVIAFIAVGALVWFALTHPAPGLLDANVPQNPTSIISNGFEVVFLLQMADFVTGMQSVGPASWIAPYTRTLMNAVAARDMNLTQAVTVTPAQDNATDAEHSTEISEANWIVGPLAHPMRTLGPSGGVYVMGALAGIALVGCGVFMTIISLRIPPSFHPPITLASWLSWLALPGCLMLCGLASIVVVWTAWRFARMERQGFSAMVDAGGVTFVRAGDTGQGQRLRWSDARGFARFAFTDEIGGLHEVFALSIAEQDFLWEALYDSSNAPTTTAGDEAWRVAAHQLTEHVMHATALPLLDLTPTLSATLAVNPGAANATWNLFGRARAIARRQGDRAFARAIAQRQARSGRLIAWFGARNGGRVSWLTPEQRAKTVQLAQALLPYYPTPAQEPHDPRARLTARNYWLSEYLFQALVIALACANFLLAVFWPFA